MSRPLYKFGRIQTHKDCPGVVAWWLMLDADDYHTRDELHHQITSQAFLESCNNPHLLADAEKGDLRAIARMPINRGQHWINLVLKLSMIRPAVTILVNAVGGVCFLTDGMIVLETLEKNSLKFPAEGEDERITIQRWEGERHYYLYSSINRIFSEPKYDTLEEAMSVANRYVPSDRIKVDEHYQRTLARAGRIQRPSNGD